MNPIPLSQPTNALIRKATPILALLATCLYIFIHWHRHFPGSVTVDLLLLTLVTTVPGVFLLSFFNEQKRGSVEMGVLGTALGIGFAATIFSCLALFGSQTYTCHTILALDVCFATFFSKRLRERYLPQSDGWTIALIGIIAVLSFDEWTTFHGIHFSSNGDLVSRWYLSTDLSFLSGVVASLKDHGVLKDLNQLGLPYAYHDFTYRVLAAVSAVSGSDANTVTSFAPQIFFPVWVLLGLWCLGERLTASRSVPFAIMLSYLYLGEVVSGSDRGMVMLSPSQNAGVLLMLSTLLLLLPFAQREVQIEKASSGKYLSELLFPCLTLSILCLTKLTIYIVIAGALSSISFIYLIRRQFRIATTCGIPVLISLFPLIAFNRGSSFTPATHFAVGMPLQNYATIVAGLLHLPINSLDPSQTIDTVGWRQLLIIPLSILHLLRYIFFYGSVLIPAVALWLYKSQLINWIAPKKHRWFFWLLIAFLPMGFLLPVLYTPTWFLSAIAFYTPIVALEIARVISMLIVGAIWQTKQLKSRKSFVSIAILILLGGVLMNVRSLAFVNSYPAWTMSNKTLEGLHALREMSSPNDIIASYRFDSPAEPEKFFRYSAIAERMMISEGAAFGVLAGGLSSNDPVHHFENVAIAHDSLKVRRRVLDSIYLSHDPRIVDSALRIYHARYLILDKSIGQSLNIDPSIIALPVFRNDAIEIWKAK